MMRFLFGILLGAVLTLLLATAVDAPTSPVMEQARGGWQRLLELTGDALFRQHAADAAAEPNREAETPTGEAAGQPAPAASATEIAGEQEALSARAALELAALAGAADPQPALLSEPVAADPASGGANGNEDAAAVPDGEASGGLIAEAAPPVSTPMEETADPDPVASVWVPFHSERSARGFARRLTTQLEHPFDVQREGAGAYSVVFSYADAAQRDALLSEVKEITGR